ncbi:exported protein of unknown function [Candidatus Methylomirabilis oxygeniifera]|uniref:Uncharacterized protein n=1 Tax=Methylomirabilis oxygeniifera TaxID=671143 RepID=D5MIE1_METO1|nr:exported protein of unknown function [Candidatus Methylomirabilis oxyfera]
MWLCGPRTVGGVLLSAFQLASLGSAHSQERAVLIPNRHFNETFDAVSRVTV